MPSYEHKKLYEHILCLDELPENAADFATWIKANEHLDLLRQDPHSDEIIVEASGPYTYIKTIVADQSSLLSLEKEDLLVWSAPFPLIAGYCWGGGRNDVWIEREICNLGNKTLKEARQLVFTRRFEGLEGKESSYYELSQDYGHVTDVHWRQELGAYCRFDERGDFWPVVSITRKETVQEVSLVSFKREPLDEYLAASHSVLIRMFDFTMFRFGNFSGWPDGPEDRIVESDDFFFRQKVVPGYAAYTTGVQIIGPSRPTDEIFASMKGKHSRGGPYVEFIAHDWRNGHVSDISTDPAETTNYFQSNENALPYELSPAFFRPEVLQKYKADHDKYTIRERDIYCRNAWSLRRYDVNEAGQVHAYIGDLRALPYEEQLYWKSFNEAPRADISQRALVNDFQGAWVEMASPLEKIKGIMGRWADTDVTWWKLREKGLLERVATPRTASRDEWAAAFGDLAKLIVEGLQTRVIRKKLNAMSVSFENNWGSLTLIEKVLAAGGGRDNEKGLEGLKAVQLIRSKVLAHSGRDAAAELATNALEEHETYTAHFESVCQSVLRELALIEHAFSCE